VTPISNTEELFFEVMTPLDFTVRVTVIYWDLIVTIKHPVMLGLKAMYRIPWRTQSRLGSVEAILKSSYSIRCNA